MYPVGLFLLLFADNRLLAAYLLSFVCICCYLRICFFIVNYRVSIIIGFHWFCSVLELVTLSLSIYSNYLGVLVDSSRIWDFFKGDFCLPLFHAFPHILRSSPVCIRVGRVSIKLTFFCIATSFDFLSAWVLMLTPIISFESDIVSVFSWNPLEILA